MAAESPFAASMDLLRKLVSGGTPPPPPVEPQPVPSDDPGMEPRVKRLEDDVRAIRGGITAIMGRLGAIEGRLGNVEGKLDILVTQVVGKIPSGWQMFGLIVSTLVAGVTILGAALGLAQWLKLIPR